MGAHGDKAAILYDQRRYDLAAEAFRRELAENPGDAWALAFLALSLTLSGRAKDGVPEAGRAVEAAPGSALAHYALSFAQLYAGNAGAALRSVHESLRINPQDADVLAHAAAIHDSFQQWDWMLRASEAGLAVDPT